MSRATNNKRGIEEIHRKLSEIQNRRSDVYKWVEERKFKADLEKV